MSMSCMRMNAGREKPPLTRSRVTQLSYPITRTDPEPLADRVFASCVAVLVFVKMLYIPLGIVQEKANNVGPLAQRKVGQAETHIRSRGHRTRGTASAPVDVLNWKTDPMRDPMLEGRDTTPTRPGPRCS